MIDQSGLYSLDIMEFFENFMKVQQLVKESKVHEKHVTIEDYLIAMASKIPIFGKDEKNIVFAELLRREGNVAFYDKRYQEAAKFYTGSLCEAPPYSTCAAISYANRSAVSFHMKLYKECILDIERALNLPYPNDLHSKLIQRRENATKSMTQTDIEPHSDVENTVPISFAPNNSAKPLSIGVELRQNDQKKYELVAKMPFATGSIVAINEPLLVIPSLNDKFESCHHCLRRSYCLLPCERCTQSCYCSEKCKAEAYNSYHRVECEIKYTISAANMCELNSADYSLRFLNIFSNQGESLADFLQVFHEMTTYSESTDKQICRSSLRTFLSLSSKINTKEQTRILFQSAYLAILLCNHTIFFKQKTDVKVVAKILEVITSIYLLHHNKIVQPGTNDITGFTVYPLLNSIPHTCITNTVAYVRSDNAMVVCASQFIKPGEKISYNYRKVHFSTISNNYPSNLRMIRHERICLHCDATYMYPIERQLHIKINKKLQKSLKDNPFDIRSLWQLLNVVHGEYQPYHWRAQFVKSLIVDSYEGRIDNARGLQMLKFVGLE